MIEAGCFVRTAGERGDMPENRRVDESGIPTCEDMSEPFPAAVTEEPRKGSYFSVRVYLSSETLDYDFSEPPKVYEKQHGYRVVGKELVWEYGESEHSFFGAGLRRATGASEGGVQAVQVPKDCAFDVKQCSVEDEVEGEDVEPQA